MIREKFGLPPATAKTDRSKVKFPGLDRWGVIKFRKPRLRRKGML
jgi:hypothetical protein